MIILQDPFVLNHNITQNVNEKMLTKIVKEMQLAVVKSERWFDVANAETKSIMDIFSEDVPVGFQPKKMKMSRKPKGLAEIGPYQFVIDMNMDKLSRADIQTLQASGSMQLTWCKKMIVFLYRQIERLLMFDCDLALVNLPVTFKPSRTYSVYRHVGQPFRPTTEEQGTEQEMEGQEEGMDGQQEVGTSQEVENNWSDPNQPSTSQGDDQHFTEEAEESSQSQTSAPVGEEYADVDFGSHGGWAPAGEAPTLPHVVDGTELVPVENPLDNDEEDEEEAIQRQEEEQRRFEEEENQRQDPSYIQYDFGDSEYYIDMDVKVMCRIWVERKNLIKELKERGFKENLQLEQIVSERLFYEVHGPTQKPVTEFRCVMRSLVSDSGASVLVDCMADKRQKEYDCIYHYMKKFVLKNVDKFFYA